jgi:high affinity Mn2+ porin
MNAAVTPGDVGVSRYPPAEGERGGAGAGGAAAAPSPGAGRGDIGVSRYPPAEGERTVPAAERQPPANMEPDDNDDPPRLPEPLPWNGTPPQASALPPGGAGDAPSTETARARVAPDGDIARTGLPGPPAFIALTYPRPASGFFDEAVKRTQGPGNTGVSRNPPAGGERGAAGGLAVSADTARRPLDIGISRYPPAEGVRESYGGRVPYGEWSWYSAHEQATVVSQAHNLFPAPYSGRNSLLPREGPATSETATIFYGARVWESLNCDGQLIFNPEIAGGTGFSRTSGIAAFPNFEITRVGVAKPTPYVARLFLRQTFGFGGEREWAADDVNQVAGWRDVQRLSIVVGKFAAPDLADDNRYAKDPRTQFLNWALAVNPAWDYPANVRGYTYGVALDYNHSKNLSFSYGVMTMPAIANGAPFDWHIWKAQGQVLEMENRYEINGRPGACRPLVFLNHAHMGNYNEALEFMPVNPDIKLTRSYRYKYGFGLNFDQALTDDLGVFGRVGWNDGHSESWAFTEVDRTVSLGLALGGRRWCRPNDRIGLAGIIDGLSGPHREYLAHGGYGFIIGDGRLSYAPEMVLETYYAWQIRPGLAVTFDFQEVANPAYNRDRGPVSVVSLRVHWDR